MKFSKQDYETLRRECLKSGCLFEDNCFPAESKSLGYNELGPYSSKIRGVVWKRPTVRNTVIFFEPGTSMPEYLSVFVKSCSTIDVFNSTLVRTVRKLLQGGERSCGKCANYSSDYNTGDQIKVENIVDLDDF